MTARAPDSSAESAIDPTASPDPPLGRVANYPEGVIVQPINEKSYGDLIIPRSWYFARPWVWS
jgi:hypothetical protein